MIRVSIFILFSFAGSLTAAPLFYSSVNSNDIDYIRAEDPSTFVCMNDLGSQEREMVGKKYFEPSLEVRVYDMIFSDGTSVEIWVHPDVKDAKMEASHFSGPLGKLPTKMRSNLDHVVLNAGDETPFAESEGHFIILATQTMRARRAKNDMEETVFHETVHATLDSVYLRDPDWANAQVSDGDFLTEYGKENPGKEDLAETTLMAYTYFHHPQRLGEVKTQMEQKIPNRLEYIGNAVLPQTEPVFYKVGEIENCTS